MNENCEKKKRRKGRGNAKGADYERLLAKRLSLWWTADLPGGPDDGWIWRTPQSGGHATTRAKLGKSANLQCSDLYAVHKDCEVLFQVIIFECKKGYNNVHFHELVDGDPNNPVANKPPKYLQWIDKAEEDRKRSGSLYWALIHQRDRRQALLITKADLINKLQIAAANEKNGPVGEDIAPCCRLVLPSATGREVLVIMPLQQFLKEYKPHHIRQLAEQAQKQGYLKKPLPE